MSSRIKLALSALMNIAMLCAFIGCDPSAGPYTTLNYVVQTGGDHQDPVGPSDLGDSAITIEPDNYEDGTDLTAIDENVTLTVALDDNEISTFAVTATEDSEIATTDGEHYAPTGTVDFGHENIPIWNDNRRLRMDFASPASAIQINFGGGSIFSGDIGRLEAYNDAGQLLAEYVTTSVTALETEVMEIIREVPDIAWAIAYCEGEVSQGRLDKLVFLIGAAQ